MSRLQNRQRLLQRWITASNILSFSRMVVSPFIVWMILQERYRFALLLFIIAALTDAADGYVARLCNEQSSLGVYLDPLADKVLFTSCFITLLLAPPHGIYIPFWFVAFVCVREMVILTGAIILFIGGYRGMQLAPTWFGKLTVALYLLLLGWLLIVGVFPSYAHISIIPLISLITGVSVLAMGTYVQRMLFFLHTHD